MEVVEICQLRRDPHQANYAPLESIIKVAHPLLPSSSTITTTCINQESRDYRRLERSICTLACLQTLNDEEGHVTGVSLDFEMIYTAG